MTREQRHYKLVDQLCREFDLQRLGQVAINVLGMVDRELWHSAREAGFDDLFVNSERIEEFFLWLREHVQDY